MFNKFYFMFKEKSMRAVYRNPKELASKIKDLVDTYLEDMITEEKFEETIMAMIERNEDRVYKNGFMPSKLISVIGEERKAVIDKVYEELQEVKEAIAENNQDHTEEEIGDLLFTVVNLSRFLKVRPNVALYRCNDKVKTRFQKLFDAAREKGIPLDKDHVDEMNQLWDEIKRDENND